MCDNLSFGKKLGSVSFQKFNGISSEDFKNSQLNDTQKKLAQALIGKYNLNGDAILDRGELQALQNELLDYAKDGELGKREAGKFFKSLGLEGMKREDIHAVMRYIASDTDNIDNAETKGDTTTVTYKPTEGGVVVEDVFKTVDGKQVRQTQTRTNITEGEFVRDTFGEDGTKRTKSEFYQDNKLSLLEEFDGNTTITTNYENGEPVSKTRQNGVVTEELDLQTGEVTKRTTDKGGGITETVEFTTDENGNAVETTTVTGQEPVTVKKDKDGNVIPKEEPKQDYKHEVKSGDTWYGIVQAKYGITDHKTTMEIVHQLKDAAGVKYSSSKMPKEITLPAQITLANGDVKELADRNAPVDKKHAHAAAPARKSQPAQPAVNKDGVVLQDPNPLIHRPFTKPTLMPMPYPRSTPPSDRSVLDPTQSKASVKYEGMPDFNGNYPREVFRDKTGKVIEFDEIQ